MSTTRKPLDRSAKDDPAQIARQLPTPVLVAEVIRRGQEDHEILAQIGAALLPAPSGEVPVPDYPSLVGIRDADTVPVAPQPRPEQEGPTFVPLTERGYWLQNPDVQEAVTTLESDGMLRRVLLVLIHLLATVETHKATTRRRRELTLLAKLDRCLQEALAGPLPESLKWQIRPLATFLAFMRKMRRATSPAKGRQRQGASETTWVLRLMALAVSKATTSKQPHWKQLLAIAKAVRPDEFKPTDTTEHLRARCEGYNNDPVLNAQLQDFLTDLALLFAPQTRAGSA